MLLGTREYEVIAEGERHGNGQSVEQSEYIHLSIKFVILYGCGSLGSKTVTKVI